MLTAEFPGRNAGFSLAENTDDLFVGKTLLHGDVLMWLMKTLLTSRCINQRGAGQSEPCLRASIQRYLRLYTQSALITLWNLSFHPLQTVSSAGRIYLATEHP
ncbi:hypothetical protein CG433_22275 [Pantoea ananatis]|nr:hypothetical protein CG432_21545 [Pantoea ananatis]PQK87889.1 hypothetical protein CG433_22275 [Pantoea ananatis]